MLELEEALKREQDRSKLLQLDLTRLRLQQTWSLGGSGSSGASSPGRLGSLDTAGTSPFGAAQAQLPPGEGGEGAAAEAPWAAADLVPAPPATSSPAVETVVISRSALELLYLKERAMDSAKEGIVIADCSLPDMPLIYANEGFSRMTGYDRSDVVGRNCRWAAAGPGRWAVNHAAHACLLGRQLHAAPRVPPLQAPCTTGVALARCSKQLRPLQRSLRPTPSRPPCRFLQQPPHGATGPDEDANVAAVEEIRSADSITSHLSLSHLQRTSTEVAHALISRHGAPHTRI